ncbi:hypothetical protein [Fusobacterium perfoetens]|uniref:hypothetical protein n=1 Tax=Fusobacterium perfoetens TaxID=852 RepID=UPI0004859BBB|nr:hypothetical protein [Fusobacterium perfoetens]
MEIGWNFPSNNYGKITGISEAGIETFKGNLYGSLAREICQNSLDARLDLTKPVLVEFKLDEIDIKKEPRIYELEEIFEKCKKYWIDNKKTMTFLSKIDKIFLSSKIRVLRISDYNTTGLTGANLERNSCWQNLVKASGVSDKGGNSGGSFGIGKSAPFACSDLRTIFYSTIDKDGIEASQGVANLVSFEESGYVTQGTGYYGNKRTNSPIFEKTSFSNFERKEIGTDIFVLGFLNDENWIDEIIKATLEGYLISIINENLVVKVENIEIKKETLGFLMEKYKEEIPVTYNYYEVLLEDKEPVEYNFMGLGKLKLYLQIKKNYKRSILMARSNGMKIFDKKRISSSIQFSGVCILEDEEINSYFREMETPQHNDWEPDRHQKPKEAKQMKKELFSYLKNAVFEKGRETITDEMDAVGIGEYIPDIKDSCLETQDNKKETISNEIHDISLEKIQLINSKMNNVRKENNFYDEIEGEGYMTDEDILNSHFSKNKSKKTSEKSNYFNGTGNEGEGNNKINKTVQVTPTKLRLLVSDDIKKIYRLNFLIEEIIENSIVELFIAGEQGNGFLTIKEAYYNNKIATFRDNKIFLGKLEKGINYSIFFILNDEDTYSMEVKINGNKI